MCSGDFFTQWSLFFAGEALFNTRKFFLHSSCICYCKGKKLPPAKKKRHIVSVVASEKIAAEEKKLRQGEKKIIASKKKNGTRKKKLLQGKIDVHFFWCKNATIMEIKKFCGGKKMLQGERLLQRKKRSHEKKCCKGKDCYKGKKGHRKKMLQGKTDAYSFFVRKGHHEICVGGRAFERARWQGCRWKGVRARGRGGEAMRCTYGTFPQLLQETGCARYYIQPGDTLMGITLKYGVDVSPSLASAWKTLYIQ
jgi:hypothetical protein